MDEVDLAAERVDAHNAASVKRVQAQLSAGKRNASGICESCGVDIEPARLRANPHALSCIDCAETAEDERRRASKCGPVG